MPTKFAEGSSLKREIRVVGVTQPVFVEITASGLSFWVKGSRKRARTGWTQAVVAGQTGDDVPSYLKDHPIELLNHFGNRGQ